MTRTEIAGCKLALGLTAFLTVYGFMCAQADYWKEVKAEKRMIEERDRALDSVYNNHTVKPVILWKEKKPVYSESERARVIADIWNLSSPAELKKARKNIELLN